MINDGSNQNSPANPLPLNQNILQLEISGLKIIRIVEVQKNVEVMTVQVKTIPRRLNFAFGERATIGLYKKPCLN